MVWSRILLGVACAIVLSGNQGLAQTGDAAGASSAQPVPNWIRSCPEDDKGKVPLCRLTQELFLKDTRQRLISVVIETRREKPQRAVKLALPLGLYIPAQVTLRVDKTKGPMRLGILTCDHGGCFTGGPINGRFWHRLQRGKQLMVTFETAMRKEVTIPVTLDGLSEALSEAKLK